VADLSSSERNSLPDSAFALPKTRQYPIHDRSHAINALARSAGKPEEAQVKAAVHKRYPSLKKAERPGFSPEGNDFELQTSIWKDDSQQLVYGVVLSPGIIDSQGDVVDEQEIQKAAHDYLVASRASDVQHSEVTLGFGGRPVADVVESYVAPRDMDVHGKKVIKGAWVIGMHVNDPDVWRRVEKGELTGYSIGGSAIREPIPS
jgi:hypothetical protein